LGYVGQAGLEHSPDGMRIEWLDVHPTLGFVPTTGLDLSPWLDQVVLARGRAVPARPRPPLPVEPRPGPIMQMRSDYRSTPRGIRRRREHHVGIACFAVEQVMPLHEPRVELDHDALVVRFTNPLPFDLAALGFVVHYEGCYGKPDAAQIVCPAEPLARGCTRSARVPVLVTRERAGFELHHLAHAIELRAEPLAGAPTLYVELDVPIARIGPTLACPPRVGTKVARPTAG
jgi:hypothetical protein